jgi:ATP-dependent Lon protease
MNVYEIDAPDRAGATKIAQAIYADIRNSHDWGRQFPERPDADVLDRLAAASPREMRRTILAAFGNAKLAGHDAIEAEDLPEGRNARKARIGF